jgi:hypothetical protein
MDRARNQSAPRIALQVAVGGTFQEQAPFPENWSKRGTRMNTDLNARIETLETKIRRLRALIVLVVIGAAAMLGAAAAPAQRSSGYVDSAYRENVEAHNFVLVGRDNKAYGRLYIRGEQPVLELYDRNGKIIWSAPPGGSFTPVNGR